MPPETLRLFVAIELPDHTRASLAAAMETLRRDLRGPYRWVSPDSIHLTLKFLGNVESRRVDLLTGALHAAVTGATPFSLSLEGLGVFPTRGSPRVLWAGIGGGVHELLALQAAVETALVAAGEAAQENAFHPHLTLARLRDPLPRPAADALRGRLRQEHRFGENAFLVTAISLIHSTLTPEGPVYRTAAAALLPSR